MESSRDFFISYNHNDRSWAEWIAWVLEENGFTTIIQAWDFRPGSNFALEMKNGLGRALRVLAVLSPNYLSSKFAQAEWAAAFARDPTGGKGILQASSLEEAAALMKAHPHFYMPDSSAQILECIPMTGM